MRTHTLGVLGQPGPIMPTNPPTKKQILYTFVCWRCGASKYLLTLRVVGGSVRVCRDCAKGMGI